MWDLPDDTTKKRKKPAAKKKVAKKKPATRKKATRKVSPEKRERDKRKAADWSRAFADHAKRKQSGPTAAQRKRRHVVVPSSTFDKFAKAGCFPDRHEWDLAFFQHEGDTYWPVNAVRHQVIAIKVVPKARWKGATHTGQLYRGKAKTIKGKAYVVDEVVKFIRKGSPLDS